jgi:lysophospholipase L1-like esterase
MGTTVRRFAVGVKVAKKNRPERLTASIDYALREMASEDAVAILLDFEKGFFGHLPIFDSTRAKRVTFTDGLHPTAEGAAVVAHTVMRYLQPLLKK